MPFAEVGGVGGVKPRFDTCLLTTDGWWQYRVTRRALAADRSGRLVPVVEEFAYRTVCRESQGVRQTSRYGAAQKGPGSGPQG